MELAVADHSARKARQPWGKPVPVMAQGPVPRARALASCRRQARRLHHEASDYFTQILGASWQKTTETTACIVGTRNALRVTGMSPQDGLSCYLTNEEVANMRAKKRFFMKIGVLAAGAMLATLAFGPSAVANPVRIHFSGAAGGGYADLILAADPDASALYQPTFSQSDADNGISPPLSPYDPEGAQHITGASGTFSAAALGINNASIVGVIATSPGVAPPGETLPKSFSWFTADGNPYSYDNLFYSSGSPLVCPPTGDPPYTFHGGFLDIFGVMFALDNGDVVGLWSDGFVPPNVFGTPGGLTFGLSVFTLATDGGYTLAATQFAGAKATVPAPDWVWLFGAGVLGLFAWRRSVENKAKGKSA